MTGAQKINRQMSSNVDQSNIDKKDRPEYRRYSSADEHAKLRPILDETFYKEKFEGKGRQTPSDIDSGTEDSEHQVMPSSNHSEHGDNEENDELTFGAYVDDEGFAETRVQTPTNETLSQPNLQNDLALAERIPHEDKKSFCPNTMHVFHAEFSRLIHFPICTLYQNLGYCLCSMEELPEPIQAYMAYSGVSYPFNAKAQFKCTGCKRLWTSMRARINFLVTCPQENGLIALEIFGQDCQICGAYGEPLWYMEEVCRVMAELANTIYDTFFPGQFHRIPTIVTEQSASSSSTRSVFYNPNQRKGKMSAPHDFQRCAACKVGKCFPMRV